MKVEASAEVQKSIETFLRQNGHRLYQTNVIAIVLTIDWRSSSPIVSNSLHNVHEIQTAEDEERCALSNCHGLCMLYLIFSTD
jgi:hypothetical protein